MREDWPLVVEKDDGLRPSGPPDECFYCHQKIGQPHGPECVVVTKTVKVRYTFEIEIEVPHHWDRGNIEFHRNEGSWCADNSITDLEEHLKRGLGDCLCPCFKCKYLQEADTTPRRKIKE